MVRLTGALSRLAQQKVLVIGDLMLDTYTIGKAHRISPEAPVAVVYVTREENRPGGAGNVVLNLISLGAHVVLLGRIGKDASGALLKDVLVKELVDVRGVIEQDGFQTPMKNRVIAENQQIVRVDYEINSKLPEALEKKIIADLGSLMEGVTAIAISDYGKGFLTATLLKAIIAKARSQNIPVITDPKGMDFTKYAGSTIIKPNLSEAYAAAGLTIETSLDSVATRILKNIDTEMLMITRSEHGLSVFMQDGKRLDFPVSQREIKDVTGAGDTVLAMLTYAFANGLEIDDAAQLSNVAAGIAIERFGCARVSISDLAIRLLETDVVNKVFDGGPIFALREALKGHPYKLLSLEGEDGMTSSVFSAIHRISNEGNYQLVIYLKGLNKNSEFVNLLSSIRDIKFIILQDDDLKGLIEAVLPSESFAVLNHKLVSVSSPLDLLT